jgi:hypothetical protein
MPRHGWRWYVGLVITVALVLVMLYVVGMESGIGR